MANIMFSKRVDIESEDVQIENTSDFIQLISSELPFLIGSCKDVELIKRIITDFLDTYASSCDQIDKAILKEVVCLDNETKVSIEIKTANDGKTLLLEWKGGEPKPEKLW